MTEKTRREKLATDRRRSYAAPKLERYGDVREITRADAMGMADGLMGGIANPSGS